MIKEIPEYSIEEYKIALDKIRVKLNDKQIEMLKLHYEAPDRQISAEQLSKSLNYSDHRPVNLQYGKIANLIGEALNKKIERQPDGHFHFWRVIAHSPDSSGSGVIWRMKPNFAEALEQSGIIAPA